MNAAQRRFFVISCKAIRIGAEIKQKIIQLLKRRRCHHIRSDFLNIRHGRLCTALRQCKIRIGGNNHAAAYRRIVLTHAHSERFKYIAQRIKIFISAFYRHMGKTVRYISAVRRHSSRCKLCPARKRKIKEFLFNHHSAARCDRFRSGLFAAAKAHAASRVIAYFILHKRALLLFRIKYRIFAVQFSHFVIHSIFLLPAYCNRNLCPAVPCAGIVTVTHDFNVTRLLQAKLKCFVIICCSA